MNLNIKLPSVDAANAHPALKDFLRAITEEMDAVDRADFWSTYGLAVEQTGSVSDETLRCELLEWSRRASATLRASQCIFAGVAGAPSRPRLVLDWSGEVDEVERSGEFERAVELAYALLVEHMDFDPEIGRRLGCILLNQLAPPFSPDDAATVDLPVVAYQLAP